ncbi:hypothetical protein HanIR_Chr04g0172371 [Helianthus annuus]|nr:hypothetical protein HanIR_Chr04g0172371 [Helianthus annuus]
MLDNLVYNCHVDSSKFFLYLCYVLTNLCTRQCFCVEPLFLTCYRLMMMFMMNLVGTT